MYYLLKGLLFPLFICLLENWQQNELCSVLAALMKGWKIATGTRGFSVPTYYLVP